MAINSFPRRNLMWLYLVVALGLMVVYLLFGSPWAFVAVGMISILGMAVGISINRPIHRLAWLLLAGGNLLWVAGDLAAFLTGGIHGTDLAAAPSMIYLLGTPLVIVSVAMLLREISDREATSILDTAAITTGAGVLLWSSAIVPYFESQSPAGVAVTVIQILLSVFLVGLAIRFIITRSASTRSSTLLRVGLLAFVVTLVATFTLESLFFWNLLHIGWLCSYVAIGAAALHPSVALRVSRPVARKRRSIVPFLVIAAGGLIVPFLFLPYVLEDHETDLIAPLIGGVVFFALTLIRLTKQGRKLHEAEHRYRTLVEQTPAVSYVAEVNDGLRLTYVSPQIKKVLGYEPSELVDNPSWRRTIHPDDLSTALGGYSSDATAELDSIFRMVAKDGSTVWVSARVRRTSDDSRDQWQGIILDISDQMRIEELESALEREREAVVKLQALDEMKNGFLQAVSHELRTPLTSIKGLGATLENHLRNLPIEDIADLVARINVNATRLEVLLADLLDVDRLSRGIFLPQLALVDVGVIVREMAANLVAPASQEVVVRCASTEILTDGSKVERIAENLISNAVKHTPPDSTIWIRVEEDDGAVLISVEDSGSGVGKDLKETIFEPFAQGQSEKSHSQGLGLGLSLVRRFTELLGGQAWVEDRKGGGAAFKVRLPVDATVPAHSGTPTAV